MDPWKSARDGDVVLLQRFVEKSAGAADISDLHGFSPLHVAAVHGKTAAVSYLVEAGFAINKRNNGGDTPLICAASHGREDVGKQLVQAGCDVRAANEHGNTALHYACLWRHEPLAKMLVAHGAHVRQLNRKGKTPLDLASNQLSTLLQEAAKAAGTSLEPVPFVDNFDYGLRMKDVSVQAASAVLPPAQLTLDTAAPERDNALETVVRGQFRYIEVCRWPAGWPAETEGQGIRNSEWRWLGTYWEDAIQVCSRRLKGSRRMDRLGKEEFMKHVSHARELRTSCDHIMPILGTAMWPVGGQDDWCLVYQDAPLGALRQMLGSQPGLDTLLRMRIAWGVAQAMAHVEMNQDHFPFVHLSPESVLVDGRYNTYVSMAYGAFGYSRAQRVMVVDPAYASPEELHDASSPTMKSAVYSFGILLAELFTGEQPFADIHPFVLGTKIIDEELRPALPEFVPESIATVCRLCWATEPTTRPPFAKILPVVQALGGH